jgi:hypothetical protein
MGDRVLRQQVILFAVLHVIAAHIMDVVVPIIVPPLALVHIPETLIPDDQAMYACQVGCSHRQTSFALMLLVLQILNHI